MKKDDSGTLVTKISHCQDHERWVGLTETPLPHAALPCPSDTVSHPSSHRPASPHLMWTLYVRKMFRFLLAESVFYPSAGWTSAHTDCLEPDALGQGRDLVMLT